MPEFKNVGVVGKQRDSRVGPTLARLTAQLKKLGSTVWVDARSADHIEDRSIKLVTLEEIASHCDLAIVVGGDGTLLAAARVLAPQKVPILGINQGRLGFMVDVNPDEMDDTLEAIYSGRYRREARILLSASIIRGDRKMKDGPFLAVNDVVIRNQAAVRMLDFETWLGDEFISKHRADGLIVSTPTGSTAYALSGGGPVLHPSLHALSLVPICPHTLSDRPIVVSSERMVRLVLGGSEGTRAMFTCDGQSNESLNPGDAVEIIRAAAELELIHPNNYNYFNILRNKLHWGRGPV